MVVGKRSPAWGSCDVLPTAAAELALNTTLDMLLSRSLCCCLCCTHKNSHSRWKKLKLNWTLLSELFIVIIVFVVAWFGLGFALGVACSLCFPFGSSWSFDTLHKNESLRPKPSCFVPFTTSTATATATATTARDALRWPRCGTRALSRFALPLLCCYLCAAAPGKLSAQVERERESERANVLSACNKARQESAPSIELPDALSGTAHALPFSLSPSVCLSFGLPDKQARSTQRKTHSMLNLSLAQGWFSLRAGILFYLTFLIEPGSVESSAAQSCLSLSPFLPFYSLCLCRSLSLGFWHASNLISVLINLAKLDDRTPYRVGIGPHFGVQLTHTPLFISAGTGTGNAIRDGPRRVVAH